MEGIDYKKLREKLVDILDNDSKHNYERIISEPTDLNKRNYIRSLFALYEAILSNTRETLAERIISRNAYQGDLDIHVIYTLMDETSIVGDNGKISKRPNQSSFKNLLKYVIKLACDEYKIHDNIFTDGWNDFVLSIQIRHKITHPKYENDISITDEELKTIERGRVWWNNTFRRIRAQVMLP